MGEIEDKGTGGLPLPQGERPADVYAELYAVARRRSVRVLDVPLPAAFADGAVGAILDARGIGGIARAGASGRHGLLRSVDAPEEQRHSLNNVGSLRA